MLLLTPLAALSELTPPCSPANPASALTPSPCIQPTALHSKHSLRSCILHTSPTGSSVAAQNLSIPAGGPCTGQQGTTIRTVLVPHHPSASSAQRPRHHGCVLCSHHRGGSGHRTGPLGTTGTARPFQHSSQGFRCMSCGVSLLHAVLSPTGHMLCEACIMVPASVTSPHQAGGVAAHELAGLGITCASMVAHCLSTCKALTRAAARLHPSALSSTIGATFTVIGCSQGYNLLGQCKPVHL